MSCYYHNFHITTYFMHIKRSCSVSRVARTFCQRAAGSFRRSRFVPKFVWMKLILISLNGVRLSSAIPLDRVAATREARWRKSTCVLSRERDSRCPRRIARSSRVTGTCLCVRTVCNCHSPHGTPRVCICQGDVPARSISVCEKMRRTRTDDEPGNLSPGFPSRENIYRRRGTTWMREEPAWSLDSKARQIFLMTWAPV